MAHALSLNDVCDALRLWATPLRALRGASAPSRNNLSHANKTRDCAMAEDVFWKVLGALLYAQMAHALSLNDVCDALRLWATPLRALRGASAPSRNNLSHANKTRDCGCFSRAH